MYLAHGFLEVADGGMDVSYGRKDAQAFDVFIDFGFRLDVEVGTRNGAGVSGSVGWIVDPGEMDIDVRTTATSVVIAVRLRLRCRLRLWTDRSWIRSASK
jgi:hypothetical protein